MDPQQETTVAGQDPTELQLASVVLFDVDMPVLGEESAHRRESATRLAELPRRQRLVVVLSFFSEMTQLQIAGQLGCSQMQVSRILWAALEQIRSELLSED